MEKTNVVVVEDDVVMQKLYETSVKEYCEKEEIQKEASKNTPINLNFRKDIKEVIYSFDLKTNDILVININSKEIDGKIELIKKIKEKIKENNKGKQSIKVVIIFDNNNSLKKENRLSMLKLLLLNLDYYLTKDIQLSKFCEILLSLGNNNNNNINNKDLSFTEGYFKELIKELIEKEIKDIQKKEKEKEKRKISEQLNKKRELKIVK